jgi:predicted RNA polymerase sigma factor
MHGRHAAPRGRVVEARQVVVNERRAVQQLDRRASGVGQPGSASPQAAATARQSWGRMRAPPGSTAWRIAAARRGGAPRASPRDSASDRA